MGQSELNRSQPLAKHLPTSEVVSPKTPFGDIEIGGLPVRHSISSGQTPGSGPAPQAEATHGEEEPVPTYRILEKGVHISSQRSNRVLALTSD